MTTGTELDARQALREKLLRRPAATIGRQPSREAFPLSSLQERVWLLSRMHPGSIFFNRPLAIRLRGALDVERLGAALEGVVARHATLRSSFVHVTGEPLRQRVAPPAAFPLPLVDCAEAGLAAAVVDFAREPFDLEKGPLIRARLFRSSPDDHTLALNIHHAVFDGWSEEVLRSDLAALYRGETLPPLAIEYGDWAAWQRERLLGERLEREAAHWVSRLDGLPPLTTFPPDGPRPDVQANRGKRYLFSLDEATTAALRSLAAAEDATLFMALYAGFAALVHRYSGLSDLAIGTMAAGRGAAETRDLVGLFVSTLVLRTRVEKGATFRTLLGESRRTVLEALEHQEMPFEVLVDRLKPERNTSYGPLVQLMFQLRNMPKREAGLAGLEAQRLDIDIGVARGDLALDVVDRGTTLDCSIEYDTDLYGAATIERIARHYGRLLAGAAATPDAPVSRIPLLDDEEFRAIVFDWNRTETGYPAEKSLDALFAEQVAAGPRRIAVIDGPKRLTYAELDAAADRIAAELRRQGAPAGSAVGVALDHCAEAIVALLGVLKAGCCFVPLDPNWPAERLQLVLSDSGSVASVGESGVTPLPGATRDAGAAEASPRHGSDTACILYTSGSTGTPKGARIPHRGITRLVRDAAWVDLTADDVVSQVSRLAFDGAEFEIFAALLNGGAVCVVQRDTLLDARALRREIEESGITVLNLASSMFRQHASADPSVFRGLRIVLPGGEALDSVAARRVLEMPDAPERLINGYGPTETSVFATSHRVRLEDTRHGNVPIGRPVPATRIYIVDEELAPQPIGVAGELCIGGDGVGLGYINRPELTAQRFVPSPFVEGDTLYRTGDLARFRADGLIEFLGRNDDQVKLRGFRIEPAEIEKVLREHAGVTTAAILALRDGSDARLVACYVGSATPVQLRRHLAASLPDFMIPSSFLKLDAIPLNANGKVDRDRVRQMDLAETGEADEPPRDDVEEIISDLWRVATASPRVRIRENFFDAGGHSLAAVEFLDGIEKHFGRRISVERFFRNPTIEGLADELRQSASAPAPNRVVVMEAAGSGTPLFFVPGADGAQAQLLAYAQLVRHFDDGRPVYGLHYEPSGAHAGCSTLEEIATELCARIREVQPRGPYLVAGECVGGIAAFEVAQQLRAAGEEVPALVLFDTRRPSEVEYVRSATNLPRTRGGNLLSRARRVVDRARYQWAVAADLPLRRRARYLAGRVGGAASWAKFVLGTAEQRADRTILEDIPWAEVLLRYRPRRYDGRAFLILSEESNTRESALAWREVIPSLELIAVPGRHRSYIREHAADAAAALRKCMPPA